MMNGLLADGFEVLGIVEGLAHNIVILEISLYGGSHGVTVLFRGMNLQVMLPRQKACQSFMYR